MTLDLDVEGVFRMHKYSGVVVKGRNNAPARDIFNNLATTLHHFYQQHGDPSGNLIMPTGMNDGKDVSYDEGTISYLLPVHLVEETGRRVTALGPGYDEEGNLAGTKDMRSAKHGSVRIKILAPEKESKWKGAAKGYFNTTKQKMLVYFNVHGPNEKEDSVEEREEFLSYLRVNFPRMNVSR